jgi:hypothetical protein
MDVSPNVVSPLDALDLRTNQSNRQFSSSTSANYRYRNQVQLKDAEVGLDVSGEMTNVGQIRMEIRKRKRVLNMSKGQISNINNSYFKQMNTHLYVGKKPTSSKDALLERPLLSHSLIHKRRELID